MSPATAASIKLGMFRFFSRLSGLWLAAGGSSYFVDLSLSTNEFAGEKWRQLIFFSPTWMNKREASISDLWRGEEEELTRLSRLRTLHFGVSETSFRLILLFQFFYLHTRRCFYKVDQNKKKQKQGRLGLFRCRIFFLHLRVDFGLLWWRRSPVLLLLLLLSSPPSQALILLASPRASGGVRVGSICLRDGRRCQAPRGPEGEERGARPCTGPTGSSELLSCGTAESGGGGADAGCRDGWARADPGEEEELTPLLLSPGTMPERRRPDGRLRKRPVEQWGLVGGRLGGPSGITRGTPRTDRQTVTSPCVHGTHNQQPKLPPPFRKLIIGITLSR